MHPQPNLFSSRSTQTRGTSLWTLCWWRTSACIQMNEEELKRKTNSRVQVQWSLPSIVFAPVSLSGSLLQLMDFLFFLVSGRATLFRLQVQVEASAGHQTPFYYKHFFHVRRLWSACCVPMLLLAGVNAHTTFGRCRRECMRCLFILGLNFSLQG